MSEIIMPTNLVVKDKATAMQYAISQARVYNEKTMCYDLDLEFAKSIFKLFCGNVELSDVANGGCCGECPTDFENKNPLSYYSKLSNVTNDDFNEEDNKIAEELDKHISESLIKNGEKTAKTYDDVAEELFTNKPTFFFNSNGEIDCSDCGVDFYSDLNNCTSRKQAEKLLAINKLLNVAKYLNGDWKPKFYDRNEKKWYIFIDEDGEFDTASAKEWVTTSVYFKSRELAEKAIEILSGYELGLALSTDY